MCTRTRKAFAYLAAGSLTFLLTCAGAQEVGHLTVQQFLWMLGSPERLQHAKGLGYIQGIADLQIREQALCLPQMQDEHVLAGKVYEHLDALDLHTKVSAPAGPYVAEALMNEFFCFGNADRVPRKKR